MIAPTTRHLVLGLLVLLSGDTLARAAAPTPVKVEERRLGASYLIQGRMSVAAPPQVVWGVVTDYADLPAFVSSMRRSAVMSRNGTSVEVEQELHARVLFLSRDLHLRLLIQETPSSHIDFHDVLATDFEAYAGSWDVRSQGPGATLLYELRVTPRQALPGGIGNSVLRRSAEKMLTELRDEILRRNSKTTLLTQNRAPHAVP